MHILLLKVWNQNFLTAFSTTPTMFCISYYLRKKDIHYNLQQRSHSLTLPSEDNNLIRKNFLHGMLFRELISKTELQFNTSVKGSSYISHIGNSKNHFVITIVI